MVGVDETTELLICLGFNHISFSEHWSLPLLDSHL